MEHPRIEKITLSMGVGDAKTNSKALDDAMDQLAVIAGQRPHITRARKSIAQFKLREGMSIGCKVTLRGNRMWEFLDRLSSVALPRIRDFRGINPDGFDGRGNYTLGLREQTIFPEIDYDRIDQSRGLNVTITTTARTDEEGRALLRHLGLPFRAEGYTAEERAARRRRKQRKYGRGRGRR
jgi:large subunit ribosomal protein L5